MTRKEQIMKDIEGANKRLFRAMKLLELANENGNQFDYVNAPRLSELADALKNRADQINKIVYQEKTTFSY